MQSLKGNADTVSLGISLARHAAYEAASVVAFEHLKQEMQLYVAPDQLIFRIEKAINDEKRHAIQVEILAKRYGQPMESFSIEPSTIRSLETIAIDNMREGCIGETWGALVGLYQAETANDTFIAATMKSIAIDEVDHASLSWDLHAWLMTQINTDARQRVVESQQITLQLLLQKTAKPVEKSHITLAGYPSPEVALILAEKLIESIVI